eukprot:6373539-Prymnesium_polylepis.1
MIAVDECLGSCNVSRLSRDAFCSAIFASCPDDGFFCIAAPCCGGGVATCCAVTFEPPGADGPPVCSAAAVAAREHLAPIVLESPLTAGPPCKSGYTKGVT